MSKFSAFGTQLQMGDGGGPEVFTTVAQVRNISGPGFSFDTIDTTAHDSPGAWEEFVPSFLHSGELTLDIIYDPALATHNNSTGLLSVFRQRLKKNWKIVWPDTAASVWAFAAYVTGFEPNAPHDDALTATVTLKLSGAPTLV